MREFVGVKSALDLFFSPNLKREALMFSRIAMPNLGNFLIVANASKRKPIRLLANELDWLLESGVIFEPEEQQANQDISDKEYIDLRGVFKQLSKEVSNETSKLREEATKLGVDLSTAINRRDEVGLRLAKVVTKAVAIAINAESNHARYESIRLRLLHNMDAYPSLGLSGLATPETKADKTETVKIAIDALPIPDESTSWEQIIEYRSDPDSRCKFLDLRHWMNEVARGELTPVEVEQKLEYLINKYQQHMKVHRMKANVGTLETIITTGAEVLGDLVSFKWGKAAQALFSLKHRQVALLEGELTAPGNEVAYIVKAKDTFS